MNAELWSGVMGNMVSAIVGGLVAFGVVWVSMRATQKQISKQEKQLSNQEIKYSKEKEVQLLWQIYFDIKKDCENSKLWEKYDQLISLGCDKFGHSAIKYTNEVIQYIMRDIRNLFFILRAKEEEEKTPSIELNILWERTGQLLVFMILIYKEMKTINENTFKYYDEANKMYEAHRIFQKDL